MAVDIDFLPSVEALKSLFNRTPVVVVFAIALLMAALFSVFIAVTRLILIVSAIREGQEVKFF